VKKILFVLIAIPVLVWAVWVVVPGRTIQSIMENSARKKRIDLEVRGVQKGLFYNFKVDELVIKGFGSGLASLRNIHVRINPLGLASLRLELSADGSVGSGGLSGRADIGAGGTRAVFEYGNVGIGDMPFLKLAGVKGTGTVSGKFSFAGDKGHVEFITDDANLQPAVFSGVSVPLNLFHSMSGAVDVRGNAIYVSSVFLEGDDVNARLKGDIKANVVDMTMELMPGRTFLQNALFLHGLDKYKVSPGYYVIPIKTSLSL
jgi:type II secretion system protein N